MDKIMKDNQSHENQKMSFMAYNPDLFLNDKSIYLLYKKVERINVALSLITKNIKDIEISKNNIRQQGLNVLSDILNLIKSQHITSSGLHTIGSEMFYLSSLIDIAYWDDLISEMNRNVIHAECEKVNKMVTELMSKYKNQFYIDSAFFSHKEEIVPEIKIARKDSNIKANNDSKNQEKSTQVKSDRRGVILGLLKDKNNLTIKDFSTVITDYSEKTIQRELLALVAEGILKKVGERRWSSYSLAQ